MSAALPSESAIDKAVNEFGCGTYDSDNGIGARGENSEEGKSETNPNGLSLPDGGGSLDPFGPDRLLGYPSSNIFNASIMDRVRLIAQSCAVDMLPGDPDAETSHEYQDTGFVGPAIKVSPPGSELPSDQDNPSARSDYYDKLTIGMDPNVWSDGDTGVYAQPEKPGSQLPGVQKNDVTMNNWLQSLGNFWSGGEIEDISGPNGFPSEDFSENLDFDRSDNQDGGKILAAEGIMTQRTATNIALVQELTESFLKDFGRKDLTKRHVLSFLQKAGEPQFLSSDIIRCLKLSHKIYVKDVMDEFPIMKTASSHFNSIASVRNKLIDLEIKNLRDPDTSAEFRRCAADLTHVLVDMEKLEDRNGE